jgi:hypothetical protein
MKTKHLLALIVLITACIYSYLASLPVVDDAGLYSEIILEVEKTGRATYLGYKETWKSPIFFYIYAFFDRFFNFLSFNPSLMVSFPCVLFFLISVFFFYKICRLFFDEKFSAIATLVFSINPLSAFIFSTPYIEAELMAFLLPSIYFYILSLKKSYFLVPAGILFAISFGIKTFEALIIPILAIFYFLEQKASKQKIFLLFCSFSFVIVPIILNFSFFGTGEMFSYDIRRFFINPQNLIIFYYYFILLLFPYSIFSLFEFLKEKSTRIFDLWFSFIFLISISANVYLWYYSPILPAIAVLATKFIRKGSKLDYLLVSFLLVYSLFVSFYVVKGIKTTSINPTSHYGGEEEVKAAEILANKSNVLLLFYSPTFVYYYSFYSKYPLSVYWNSRACWYERAYSTEQLEDAFSFKGEDITSGNKMWFNEIESMYANPIQNISFVVVRDIDYMNNSKFFSNRGYYPYIIFSKILILKKY